MSRRISPYLLLGIDYGATTEQAEQAFSRKVRALRGKPDSPVSREDLTWALNAIQQPTESLANSVEYFRVPAGRAKFSEPQPGELFCPHPQPVTRRTRPLDGQDRATLRVVLTIRAIKEVVEVALGASHDPYTTSEEGSE